MEETARRIFEGAIAANLADLIFTNATESKIASIASSCINCAKIFQQELEKAIANDD